LNCIQIGKIQVIAFQSSDGKQNSLSRPIPLSPVNKSSIIHIDSSPSSSDNLTTRSGYFKGDSPEQDTGDSRSAGASKVYFILYEIRFNTPWRIDNSLKNVDYIWMQNMVGLECLFPIYIFVSEVLKDQGNSFLYTGFCMHPFVDKVMLILWKCVQALKDVPPV
jgi:hypothetical protein